MEEATRELGHRFFILDMEELTFMDSSGIGIISNLCKKVSEENGLVGLVKPSQEILDLINFTRLGNQVEIFPSVEDAEAKVG